MARRRKPEARRKVRIDLQQPGFLIPEPDAPWIECTIIEISDEGVSLEVGALAVPQIFGLAFTASGEVLRVCEMANGSAPASCRRRNCGRASSPATPRMSIRPLKPVDLAERFRGDHGCRRCSPRSLPVARLMKCSRLQAWQTTVSYEHCGSSGVISSACQCTFIPVMGHLKMKLAMANKPDGSQGFCL